MQNESTRFKDARRVHLAESVGLKIKDYREFRRMSQRELAERAGVTQSTLALIEKGRTNPGLLTLEKIADAIGREITFGLRIKA